MELRISGGEWGVWSVGASRYDNLSQSQIILIDSPSQEGMGNDIKSGLPIPDLAVETASTQTKSACAD